MQKIPVNFKDGVIIDGNMWVFDNVIQAICKIDIDTCEMTVVDRYNGPNDYLATWILYKNKKIYLLNTSSSDMLVYDCEIRNFTEVINENKSEEKKDDTVTNVFLHKDVIWITPLYLTGHIWCYDVEKKRYEVKDLLLTSLKKCGSDTLAIVYPTFWDEKMWVAVFGGRSYLKYDLETENIEIFEVNETKDALGCVATDGNKTYATRIDTDEIYLIDKTGKMQTIDQGKKISKAYNRIIDAGKYKIALSRNADNILLIEKDSLQMKKIEIDVLKGSKDASNYLGKIFNYCFCEDKLFLFVNELRCMLDIVCKNLSCLEVEINSEINYNAESVRRSFVNSGTVSESSDRTLESLLAYCRESL